MNLADLQRRVLAGSSKPLLLDAFPNAAAAYSLRLLRKGYTGNCIEVRRSSDNTTQNIGFVNGVLDTSSLLSFVGAGDGFVRTWYDQSGAGLNISQSTNSLQPRIVISGILYLENQKPSLFFSFGINGQFLRTTSGLLIPQPTEYYGVGRLNPVETSFLFDSFEASGSANRQAFSEAFLFVGIQMLAGVSLTLTTYPTSNFFIFNPLYKGASSLGRINNSTLVSGDSGTNSQNWGRIGATQNFNPQSVSELIIYPSDQSTNRILINDKINEFYKIYGDETVSGILHDYPATAAYSLRQLVNYKNGHKIDLIEVRRSIDNSYRTFTEDEINNGTLVNFCQGGDGFIRTFFDQSGNNNHAKASGTEHKIVNAGVLLTVNGKPAIPSNGVTMSLTSTVTINTIFAVAQVAPNVNTFNVEALLGSNISTNSLYSGGTLLNGIQYTSTSGSLITNVNNTNQNLITVNATNGKIYNNADLKGIGTASPISINLLGGRRASGNFFHRGNFQEFILYSSDQSSNRTAIEQNINSYYNIY
jgi:hypothetical protein